jgi:hypothetical protein
MTATAGVRYDETSHTMTIGGKIEEATTLMVRTIFAGYEVHRIVMDGPGGLFLQGLAIGRAIRAEGASVVIQAGTDCSSSCAMAAMGSKRVIVQGRLTLHRPYIMSVPSTVSPDEYAGVIGRAYMEMADFLIEMGYSMSLAKAIVRSTSPCKFLVIGSTSTLDMLRVEKPRDLPTLPTGVVDNCNR